MRKAPCVKAASAARVICVDGADEEVEWASEPASEGVPGSRRAIGVEASVPNVIKDFKPDSPSTEAVGEGMASTKE
jgi:hypothetical protein